MSNKLQQLWLQYQLLRAERNAIMEARAAMQARSNTIHYQLKANQLRKKIQCDEVQACLKINLHSTNDLR